MFFLFMILIEQQVDDGYGNDSRLGELIQIYLKIIYIFPSLIYIYDSQYKENWAKSEQRSVLTLDSSAYPATLYQFKYKKNRDVVVQVCVSNEVHDIEFRLSTLKGQFWRIRRKVQNGTVFYGFFFSDFIAIFLYILLCFFKCSGTRMPVVVQGHKRA